MDTKRIVAKRIRLARVERDLKQSQLAELLDISQGYITKLESGRINIGVETVVHVAQVLNKPIEYFFMPFEEDTSKKAQSPGARAKKRKAA